MGVILARLKATNQLTELNIYTHTVLIGAIFI